MGVNHRRSYPVRPVDAKHSGCWKAKENDNTVKHNDTLAADSRSQLQYTANQDLLAMAAACKKTWLSLFMPCNHSSMNDSHADILHLTHLAPAGTTAAAEPQLAACAAMHAQQRSMSTPMRHAMRTWHGGWLLAAQPI